MSVYRIADLPFAVEGGVLDAPLFRNYHPFRAEASAAPLLFMMRFGQVERPAGTETCRYRIFWGLYRVWLRDDKYVVEFRPDGWERGCWMQADKMWTHILVEMTGTADRDISLLDMLLVVAFVYSSAYHNAVLLHASCVKTGETGIAFIGASGVGKSTHSSLWIQHVPGTSLLNDDQPVVRLIDGVPYIFGSPWSGKTDCYKNEKARLEVFFLMRQAIKNEVERVSPKQSFITLLSLCGMMKEDKETFSQITQTCAELAERVKMFKLSVRPEKSAVELAYSCLNK